MNYPKNKHKTFGRFVICVSIRYIIVIYTRAETLANIENSQLLNSYEKVKLRC